MKKTAILTIMILPALALARADNASVATSTSVVLPIVLTPVKHGPFYPGEKLEFDIKYEFVHAGEATLEVQRNQKINDRPTITFVSTAKSNSFVDNFFRVRDYNASHVDELSMATLNFHQNLHEGGYKVIRNTWIDYKNGKYVYERLSKGKRSERSGPITQQVSDILSAFYYARSLPLELGKDYFLTVFSDGDVYPLKLSVGSQMEKIKVRAGEFECLKVTPFVVGDAIFKASDGKMTIWMTNDAYRMPVLIRSKVAVGAFDAELFKFKYGIPDKP